MSLHPTYRFDNYLSRSNNRTFERARESGAPARDAFEAGRRHGVDHSQSRFGAQIELLSARLGRTGICRIIAISSARNRLVCSRTKRLCGWSVASRACHPYWTALSLKLNELGLGGSVSHNVDIERRLAARKRHCRRSMCGRNSGGTGAARAIIWSRRFRNRGRIGGEFGTKPLIRRRGVRKVTYP